MNREPGSKGGATLKNKKHIPALSLLVVLLLASGALYYANSSGVPPAEQSAGQQAKPDEREAQQPQETDSPPGGGPAAYSLTVDTANPGAVISPMLYGAFFEEINHAGDGGLYAELISNRSFEDHPDTLFNWWAEERGGSRGSVALSDTQLLNDTQTRALALTVAAAAEGGQVSAVNNGYWGNRSAGRGRIPLILLCPARARGTAAAQYHT